MTAEGIFPKIDGDALYASEINGFYNITGSPAFKTTGSLYVSGVAGVYTAGSLVFTNVSGVCLSTFSYLTVAIGGDNPQDYSEYQGAKVSDSSVLDGNHWISTSVPMVNNGSFVFMIRFPSTTGHMTIGSIYVFGGQPGVTITKSW